MSSANDRRKASVIAYALRVAGCVRRGELRPEHVVNRYARGGKGWYAFEQGLRAGLGSHYVPPQYRRLYTRLDVSRTEQTEAVETSLLFVYGTLKRGYGNHARFLRESRFVGQAVTVDVFGMSTNGIPFVYPARFVTNPALHGHVEGEVYEVDRPTRDAIDSLEGHPDFYTRTEVGVTLLHTSERLEAEAYLILRAARGSLTRPDVLGRLEWRGM